MSFRRIIGWRNPQRTIPAARSLRGVESLAPRILLDAEGTLTGVDVHLTLSFAPDGTDIAGDASALESRFDAVAAASGASNPRAAWHNEILRAFQTWAVQTNADIGLVPDGGQPFGSPGPSRRDARFGDVRIGGIDLPSNVGAVSIPSDELVAGTWLADVVFNTSFNYQSLHDIYAVALHEAGNVFGLNDNADAESPLFTNTGGLPTGLPPTPADLAALHKLHGVRSADPNESPDQGANRPDNDSLANATRLQTAAAAGDEGTAPSIVYGDIADGDVDFFEFHVPDDYSGPLTLQLRTLGMSQLAPRLQIFDRDGTLLTADQRPTSNSDSVFLHASATNEATHRFYFAISAASSAVAPWNVGGYSLTVLLDNLNQASQAEIDAVAGGAFRNVPADEIAKLFDIDEDDFLNDDLHVDDELSTAADLQTTPGFIANGRFSIIASISDAADVDSYKFSSPESSAEGDLDVVTILVRSLEPAGLIPQASLFDEDDAPIAATILANGGGEYLIQATLLEPGGDYSLQIAAADPTGAFQVGNYELTVSFASQPTELATFASGVVGDAPDADGLLGAVQTFFVARTQLFHFVLQVDPVASAAPTALLAQIRDEQGDELYRMAAHPGESRSTAAVMLAPGAYSLETSPVTFAGAIPPVLHYQLLGIAISDPFVGDPTDPTASPFACTEPQFAGLFCYPGGFPATPDPYLWDDFIDGLPDPPPEIGLPETISLLLGDWWTWVWNETGSGSGGPPLGRPDVVQVPSVTGQTAQALAPGESILANDIDPLGANLVAVLQAGPTHGSLQLNADGTFTYAPVAGFAGHDQFTYTASNFQTISAATTVSIVVGPSGDFNANGRTDGFDFLTWQRGFGATSGMTLTEGDGNMDGRVNNADLALWENSSAATSAVQAAASAPAARSAAISLPRSAWIVEPSAQSSAKRDRPWARDRAFESFL